MKSIWEILELDATTDRKKIKQAYAKKAALFHPEEHPEAFMELHHAYQQALAYAKQQNNTDEEQSESQTYRQNQTEKQASPTFPFDQILEAARLQKQQSLKQASATLLQRITILLKQKRAKQKDWSALVEDPKFQAIALEPMFIDALLALLQTSIPLPFPCIFALTYYYQNQADEMEDSYLDALLQFLDAQNEVYEQNKARKQKQRNKALLMLALLICLLLLFWQAALALYLFIILSFSYYIHHTHHQPQKRLGKGKLALLLIGFFCVLLAMITYMTTIGSSERQHAIRYVKETYGEHISFEHGVRNTNKTEPNTDIFSFYDEQAQFSFLVKCAKKAGNWICEDNYQASFLSQHLPSESLQHYHPSMLPTQSDFSTKDFTITLEEASIPTLSKDLYRFLHSVDRASLYPYMKGIMIYPIVPNIYINQGLGMRFEELYEKEEEALAHWLLTCLRHYQLYDTTLPYQPDDPITQELLAQMSGVELTYEGTTYHCKDIDVVNGNLSLGNFYRLAQALSLSLSNVEETSLQWEYHGHMEILRSNSPSSYLSFSLFKLLLENQRYLSG